MPNPFVSLHSFKADPAIEDQKHECVEYPYRRAVRQLMNGIGRIMIGIIYALNILSRCGNDLESGHLEHLKHLLKHYKYSELDRLTFYTHGGLKGIGTITQIFQ